MAVINLYYWRYTCDFIFLKPYRLAEHKKTAIFNLTLLSTG